MKRLLRFLKFAEKLDGTNDINGLNKLSIYFDAFIKKHAQMDVLPNSWRSNIDYTKWENSPYFGSMTEFMEKFPGGVRDWVEWRKGTKKECNLKWGDFKVKKKAGQRIKMANKQRKAIYSGVFLTDDSKTALIDWWEGNIGDLLPKHFMHYMAIKFKPVDEDIIALPIGETVKLTIVGYGNDEKAQAVKVNGFVSGNPIPHVTVATDGTSPVYSNDLLSANTQPPVGSPPDLIGTVGYYDGKDVVFSFDGTIYDPKTSLAHFVDTKEDNTKKFEKEPHLWSDEGLEKFDSVSEFLKKYRGQEANDASEDFIKYYKLLRRIKSRRKKAKK